LSAFSAGDAVRQGELDLGLGELCGVDAEEVLGGDLCRADDLYGAGAGTVSASHFVVELRDGAGELDIPELAVHVVRSRAGRVTQPNAVVLDDAAVLLHELDAVQDFTRRLLHLAELVHVVPEFRLGDRRVGGKDDHAVGLGVGVFLVGGVAADHLVLAHQSSNSHDFWVPLVRRKRRLVGVSGGTRKEIRKRRTVSHAVSSSTYSTHRGSVVFPFKRKELIRWAFVSTRADHQRQHYQHTSHKKRRKQSRLMQHRHNTIQLTHRLTGGSDGERHDGDPTGSGRVRARGTTPGERGR
jgi:hypothetical protein